LFEEIFVGFASLTILKPKLMLKNSLWVILFKYFDHLVVRKRFVSIQAIKGNVQIAEHRNDERQMY